MTNTVENRVTRTVCAHCGNTRAEIRAEGDTFRHAHEFIRWTGIEERFPQME